MALIEREDAGRSGLTALTAGRPKGSTMRLMISIHVNKVKINGLD